MDSSVGSTKKIKFLYSYGGKIIPRPSDGMLRYVGGFTRVLAVDRSITFLELMVKFGESCGSSMSLKCKLPSEDLDLLISVKSDMDLKNVVEEYDRASPEMKIRAILSPIKTAKKISPPTSPMSCFDFPSSARKPQRKISSAARLYCKSAPPAAVHRCPQAVHWCCSPTIHKCSSPAFGSPVPPGKHRGYEGLNSRNLRNIAHMNYSYSHGYCK